MAQEYLSTNDTVISPLSVHLLAYFGQKDGLKLDFLLDLIAKFCLTDFSTEEVAWASVNRQGEDFEDALQVACAVGCGARAFVTFDRSLAKRYGQFIKMKVLVS